MPLGHIYASIVIKIVTKRNALTDACLTYLLKKNIVMIIYKEFEYIENI